MKWFEFGFFFKKEFTVLSQGGTHLKSWALGKLGKEKDHLSPLSLRAHWEVEQKPVAAAEQ